ncbi:hypothetical protein ACSSS7_001222 [Eimeria intestinalis]
MGADNERSRRYGWLPEDQQGLPATMSSAAGAGLLSRAVMHPLDTAKAVIQVQTKGQNAASSFFEGSRTLRTLSSIWKADGLRGLYRGFGNLTQGEGLRALYRGYGATLLSFGPFSALFFTLNHQFSQVAQRLLPPKLSASQQSGSGRRPLVDATVASAAAGVAAFVTAPLDKVKLRLQVQSDAVASQKTPFYYRHVFHGLSSLLKTEGLSGCFAGAGARTTFQAGSFFVMFLFMQNVRNLYCQYFEA